MAISGTGGTVSFIDSKPLLTGSFSGLDTAALIQSALTIQRLPAISLENRITENDTKIAAFSDLKTVLDTLGTALNGLRNPPGISGLSSNTFENKAIFLSSDSSTAATEILGATADATAAAGVHTIEVQQVATAHKVSSTTVADPDAALGITETLTIGLAGAATEEQYDLDIDSTTTVRDIVNAVNTQTGTTGVRASLVQVSDTDYRLVFTAEETNKDVELIGTTGITTSTLGISSDNGATYDVILQAANPAQILVDGITDVIERDNNEIDDVITGVTFDVFKAEVGTTLTLEVENDLTAIRQQLQDFVDSYNVVRSFLREQQQVTSEGETAETALLFSNNLVRTLGTGLGSDLASLVSGLDSTALSTLADIGIELDTENFLTIDTGTLDAALVDNLDEVRGVLEFGFASTSSEVSVITRSATLDIGTFDIDVPAGAIDGTNLQVSGVDAFEVDGNILRGLDGTDYEGLSLAFVRDTSDASEPAETITITTTLGIAESLYQTVQDYTDFTDGLITEEITRIEEQNSDYADQIAAIDARLEFVQQALIAKYAALETVLAEADAISSQLKAFLNSSSG